MPAKGTALRRGKTDLVRIACLPGCSLRLKDSVFLWAERRLCDVLSPLQGQSQHLRSLKEDLFFLSHRSALDWQRRLYPFVVRDQIAIRKGEQVIGIVCLPIRSVVTDECAWHGTRRVALIVVRRAADSSKLNEQHALWNLPYPFSLGSVCRPKSEIAEIWVVGIALEMSPVHFRVCKPRAR